MFNSRKDLDAAPEEQKEKFLSLLETSINKWAWNGSEWEIQKNTSEIEKFDFGLSDFPNAPVPPKPDYNPDDREREQNAEEIRAQRNALLADSDWTQVADAPVDSSAWATYRQALRDVPQQDGFPEEVTWPTKP